MSCAQTPAVEGWKNGDSDFGDARCPRLQSQLSGTHEGGTLTPVQYGRQAEIDGPHGNSRCGESKSVISPALGRVHFFGAPEM
jgi:hypothetical protein